MPWILRWRINLNCRALLLLRGTSTVNASKTSQNHQQCAMGFFTHQTAERIREPRFPRYMQIKFIKWPLLSNYLAIFQYSFSFGLFNFSLTPTADKKMMRGPRRSASPQATPKGYPHVASYTLAHNNTDPTSTLKLPLAIPE